MTLGCPRNDLVLHLKGQRVSKCIFHLMTVAAMLTHICVTTVCSWDHNHVCLGTVRLRRFLTNLLYRRRRLINTLYNNNNPLPFTFTFGAGGLSHPALRPERRNAHPQYNHRLWKPLWGSQQTAKELLVSPYVTQIMHVVSMAADTG